MADPWRDADVQAAGEIVRTEAQDVLIGASPAPAVAGDWRLRWWFAPAARFSFGDGVPENLSGDEELGAFRGVLIPAAAVSDGPFVVRISPEIGYEDDLAFRPRGFVGIATAAYTLGFGKRDRWIGPARHGALTRSDNAEPPWMAEAAIDGRLPGIFDIAGHFRFETDLGWLDQPRPDVSNPGLLAMNLRWSPVPEFELGLNRLSIFGGEGRPAVDVGQMFIPSEPHVANDPDHLLPDQDELASLDFRVTLPLHKWLGGPVRYVEGWWEYGGEDMVVRQLGSVPYPSLAGVGNTYGGEVAVGPVVVTGEYTRLMDDYFRWYVGHRIYHDGFTQNGRVIGHFGGPDSETMFGSVAVRLPVAGRDTRARAWVDSVRRVGVIEQLKEHVFAFPTEDRRWRVGLDGEAAVAADWRAGVGYAFEQGEGIDFVPGASRVTHRVVVSVGWRGVGIAAAASGVAPASATALQSRP